MSDAYRLTFLLPDIMLLRVPEGRHQPCLAGTLLRVERGLVTIEAPSRERCQEQARRLFRLHAKQLPAFECAAIVETPAAAPGGRARDEWTIVVNSEVTFAPTGLGADIDPRPQLTIISAG